MHNISLPNDLGGLDTSDLLEKHRELGYYLDSSRSDHTEEAETRRLKIEVARAQIRQELRRRGVRR